MKGAMSAQIALQGSENWKLQGATEDKSVSMIWGLINLASLIFDDLSPAIKYLVPTECFSMVFCKCERIYKLA